MTKFIIKDKQEEGGQVAPYQANEAVRRDLSNQITWWINHLRWDEWDGDNYFPHQDQAWVLRNLYITQISTIPKKVVDRVFKIVRVKMPNLIQINLCKFIAMADDNDLCSLEFTTLFNPSILQQIHIRENFLTSIRPLRRLSNPKLTKLNIQGKGFSTILGSEFACLSEMVMPTQLFSIKTYICNNQHDFRKFQRWDQFCTQKYNFYITIDASGKGVASNI